MSGAIKVVGEKGRPKSGIILARKKQTVEEINERQDFVTQGMIGSQVRIKGQDWKIRT